MTKQRKQVLFTRIATTLTLAVVGFVSFKYMPSRSSGSAHIHNGHVYKLEQIPDKFTSKHTVWWADGLIQTNFYYPAECSIPNQNVMIVLGFVDDGTVVWKEKSK